uniref:Uncharacterized protein n=1 Tax=Rousettus aegyptiacus TaxID=9407 RepID=A0A7J8BT14_ROUAE|nr:hypothetical protein HJG63_009647 [Rousettus aegyptiacus]
MLLMPPADEGRCGGPWVPNPTAPTQGSSPRNVGACPAKDRFRPAGDPFAKPPPFSDRRLSKRLSGRGSVRVKGVRTPARSVPLFLHPRPYAGSKVLSAGESHGPQWPDDPARSPTHFSCTLGGSWRP